MRKLHCVLLLGIVVVSMFALTGLMIPASGELELAETSTKTIGATTITWNSSFHDTNYTLGNIITMTVTWTVDAGAADYHSFVLRGPEFTPKGKDPAEGNVISTSWSPGSTTVTVTFRFTDLHRDWKRMVEIGNAKFKLYLWIDKDGNGSTETLAGYGVNVHVEDPAPW